MSVFVWVFLGAVLALCVIPMLFMGKRSKDKPDDNRDDKGGGGSAEL